MLGWVMKVLLLGLLPIIAVGSSPHTPAGSCYGIQGSVVRVDMISTVYKMIDVLLLDATVHCKAMRRVN